MPTSPPPDQTRAIAIGIDYTRHSKGLSSKDSLAELCELAKTASLTVVTSFTQRRLKAANRSYVGEGKLADIKAYIQAHQITCVLTDDELTPAQSKYLEQAFCTIIIDRTSLILDIFAQHARSYESKLQIELAQLNYLLPRLTRLWTHLSRLGGGIGTRGPGETQLEVDKRQIAKRVSHIKTKLKKIQNDRQLRRKKRKDLPVITGAIVGYTNAGKSTLMNALTQSSVLAADKLFATLDPISRKFSPNKSDQLVLTDTVGFIQKLPTHLIKAFYSTLEEVTEADFLIHVIDASHPCFIDRIQTSQAIIKTLNATQKPILYVFNKWDKVAKKNIFKKEAAAFTPSVFISAKERPHSLDTLLAGLDSILTPFKKTLTFFVPYTRMDIVTLLHDFSDVQSVHYTDSIVIKTTINQIIGDKILASLYHSAPPHSTATH